MRLLDHLQARGAQRALARKLKCPASLISQWANDKRSIPAERCVEIERATEGAVTRRDLRPDDWHRIWPELAERLAAQA